QADPRAVYLPEPNTFIRLDQNRLENNITFGVQSNNSTTLTYTSKEGRGLATSVEANRYNADPKTFTVFDPTLTITTDSDRLLSNYDRTKPD
ncbi:hypothetical protein, partial [Symbioplanes lichenis]|uniref:hypothetical protein n=1 Tax=Symbioplanes lichenis TaxID=1629072 RepID=UPI0027393991